MNVICFHLLNDYSGSPKILSQVITALSQVARVHLVTTKSGILDSDDIKKFPIKFHYYRYAYSNNPIATIARYVFVQIYSFIFSFRFLFHKNCVFYINTILPVGPAIAAFIMRKRIVYHYHEDASAKGFVYRALSMIMQKIANQIICVSNYQRSFVKRNKNVVVVPNALSNELFAQLKRVRTTSKDLKTVLMLSSLKAYKGVSEFVKLAAELPAFSFILVVNDTRENINKFFSQASVSLPNNISLFPRQSDVVSFYEKASLVLNLTKKDQVVETFGLTILEAITAGIPVITPTIGGIAELVEDGVNGYKVDVQNFDKLKSLVVKILENKELHDSLSKNSCHQSEQYQPEVMIKNICRIIQN